MTDQTPQSEQALPTRYQLDALLESAEQHDRARRAVAETATDDRLRHVINDRLLRYDTTPQAAIWQLGITARNYQNFRSQIVTELGIESSEPALVGTSAIYQRARELRELVDINESKHPPAWRALERIAKIDDVYIGELFDPTDETHIDALCISIAGAVDRAALADQVRSKITSYLQPLVPVSGTPSLESIVDELIALHRSQRDALLRRRETDEQNDLKRIEAEQLWRMLGFEPNAPRSITAASSLVARLKQYASDAGTYAVPAAICDALSMSTGPHTVDEAITKINALKRDASARPQPLDHVRQLDAVRDALGLSHYDGTTMQTIVERIAKLRRDADRTTSGYTEMQRKYKDVREGVIMIASASGLELGRDANVDRDTVSRVVDHINTYKTRRAERDDQLKRMLADIYERVTRHAYPASQLDRLLMPGAMHDTIDHMSKRMGAMDDIVDASTRLQRVLDNDVTPLVANIDNAIGRIDAQAAELETHRVLFDRLQAATRETSGVAVAPHDDIVDQVVSMIAGLKLSREELQRDYDLERDQRIAAERQCEELEEQLLVANARPVINVDASTDVSDAVREIVERGATARPVRRLGHQLVSPPLKTPEQIAAAGAHLSTGHAARPVSSDVETLTKHVAYLERQLDDKRGADRQRMIEMLLKSGMEGHGNIAGHTTHEIVERYVAKLRRDLDDTRRDRDDRLRAIDRRNSDDAKRRTQTYRTASAIVNDVAPVVEEIARQILASVIASYQSDDETPTT